MSQRSRPIENVQRVGFLVVVPGLLRQFGVEPAQVLAAVGLKPDALANPNGTIPYATMGSLLTTAAEQTRCAHFGLLVGAQVGIASLGLPGELMLSAPTIGAALRDFIKEQHRNAHGSVAYLLRQGGRTIFGYAVYQARMAAIPHVYDGAAAAAFNIVNQLRAQEAASEIEVLFARSEPADLTPYRQFFGTRLVFNAEQTGVRFPSVWLELSNPGADAGMRAALGKRIAEYQPAGELDILTRLRRTLRVALFSGQPPADDEIAGQLGMHQRQLHRLLSSEGYNFKMVLSELRFSLAQQLLEHTTLRLLEISQLLGFSHPSAFSRAFTRSAGMPALSWRSRAGLAADGHTPR